MDKGPRESDGTSKTQPPVKREKDHNKDRGGSQTPSHLRQDREELRESSVHRHKLSHGKKEKSGHREGRESTATAPHTSQPKLGREEGKAPKNASAPMKKEAKREKDTNHKERKKANPASEHKAPRTLITFDLFKPMEAHQTLPLSFTEGRPKTHHHSDFRGSSSKPGPDSRTIMTSKGPKVKDMTQVKSALPIQDTRPQHSLKHPLKPHTPQQQKDFLL